jgi:hypothetical protein
MSAPQAFLQGEQVLVLAVHLFGHADAGHLDVAFGALRLAEALLGFHGLAGEALAFLAQLRRDLLLQPMDLGQLVRLSLSGFIHLPFA